jgi:large subunit ribosomal protein L19
MALFATHNKIKFGVGDRIRVIQKVNDRTTVFEGIVIAIKNRGENKTFTVRRIGEQKIGIERIFPLSLPSLEKIDVLKKGTAGVRRAKLYYIRGKSPKEVEKIYSR